MEKQSQKRNCASTGERKKTDERKEDRQGKIPNAVRDLPFTVRPIRA